MIDGTQQNNSFVAPTENDVSALCALFVVPGDILLSREQLLTALRPQSRWTECGNVMLHDITNAGIDERSIRILQDREALEALLDFCEIERILESIEMENDRSAYRAGPQMRFDTHEGFNGLDGLALLCHICPRDGFVDQEYVLPRWKSLQL